MPAPVINGIFSTAFASLPTMPTSALALIQAAIPNTLNTTITLNSLVFSGSNPSDASDPGTNGFPITLNPGQTAVITVKISLGGTGARQVQVTVQTSAVGYSPAFGITAFGSLAPAASGVPSPYQLTFPNTKVGLTTTFANMQIANTFNAPVTVTALAMQVGTDFFLVGAPVVPFVVPANSTSANFSVQFTPTTTGVRQDAIQVTIGGVVYGGTANIQGTGTTLQSAFNLTGGTSGTLFAFPGTAANPLILIANPNSLNCEEPGSFTKLHDFQLPNVEKQWMRIRGHYEDLGPVVVSFQLRSRRVGKPDEIIQVAKAIGTVFADGWIREFDTEPTPITGELVQITVSRSGGGGPVSLIDYMPCYEPKGEVISGT